MKKGRIGLGKGREKADGRLVKWMMKRTGGRYPGRSKTEEYLRLLGTGGSLRQQTETYYADKFRTMLAVLAGGLALAILLHLGAGQGGLLTEGYLLPRKEKAYTHPLNLYTEEGKKERFSVEVEPRRLTEAESRALLKETAADMESYILGDNRSLEEVRSNLNLIRNIEGTPVTVEWELDNYETLNLDGSLRLENLRENGSLTELTARLICGEEEEVYRAVVRVYPPLLTEEEEWERTVQEAVAAVQSESSRQEFQKLPEVIGDTPVRWEEDRSPLAGAALFLSLAAAAAVYAGKDRELQKQVKEREQQMLRDYAKVVSKLVLLMGAGAAVRTAWEMIVRDYQEKKERGAVKHRYIYEEMALACREMQNGVAETKAYENFGLRCRLPCYLKLSALLEQNLRKGGKGLSQILNGEITEAFEQRKDCALRQGEEASTRLLFPLVMLLGVVMLLILVPAGMSMKI